MARNFTFRIDRFAGLNCGAAEDAAPGMSPDMLNFKITPEGELVKRAGCSLLLQGNAIIRGMWCGKTGARTLYAVVYGSTLWASSTRFEDVHAVSGTVPGNGEVQLFPFMGSLYLFTGAGILCYDGTTLSAVEPYEPLLTTATSPRGDGTPVNDVNALTPCVRQSFDPDGTSVHYRLAVQDILDVDRVERGGQDLPDNSWYWDDITQTVTFLNAPQAYQEPLIIHYRVASYDENVARQIRNCRRAAAFGGANDTRVFLYGSADAPAVRFHSGMVSGKPNLGYFPVLNYTLVGDGSPITGILRHYDRQLIFTEKAAYYSTLAYETEADGRTRAIFPVYPLSDDRGNLPIGQPLLVENEPVTVTEAGLFRWISTNVRDERNARLFSQPVRELLETMNMAETRLFNRKSEGELFIVNGREILVYRYGTGAFYRYRVEGMAIRFMAEMNGELFFAAGQYLCRVGGQTDLNQPFTASWISSFLTPGDRDREKNLFSASLCLDTLRGDAACTLEIVTPAGETAVRASEHYPAGSRSRILPFLVRHCHAERFQARLTESGSGRLHVRYLVLRGKICDKHV